MSIIVLRDSAKKKLLAGLQYLCMRIHCVIAALLPSSISSFSKITILPLATIGGGSCRIAKKSVVFLRQSSKYLSTKIRTMEGTNDEVQKNNLHGDTVNLLSLASACVACTNAASVAIRTVQNDQTENTRLKGDGSYVTDADFIAQGVIVDAIRSVSKKIRILGEESEEEMTKHMHQHSTEENLADNSSLLNLTNYELRLRYHKKVVDVYPLACSSATSTAQTTDSVSSDEKSSSSTVKPNDLEGLEDPVNCIVDASRVSVVVDPLDGTKSFANGEYDVVSILIAILLDNQPYFGVIGKPFGCEGLSPMLDTTCVAIYGGPLLDGVYVAGQNDSLTAVPIQTLNDDQSNLDELPRAVISSSRSKGVVNDFCIHLSGHGLIHPEPLMISGAGEKSLRLILHRNREALWFFPKGGTSRWDIAASDALLRTLGGKLTDKFGKQIDYSTNYSDSENVEGIIACSNAELHDKCMELFLQGDWINQR